MDLREYLNAMTVTEQNAFVKKCESSLSYLRKAISVKQLLAPALCVTIEIASAKSVTRKELRPDDWEKIWPELAILPILAVKMPDGSA
jgi:DNA-binding transcriptional regulator YdaS (Cro superfamily)